MIPIRFIKQSLKRINNSLLLIVCFLIFYNCSDRKGFSLQQFEIKNTQLDSVIHSFVDSINRIKDLSHDIPIMALHHIDSFPAFYFTIVDKENVSPNCIFNNNRRIVGYIKTKNKDMIVLTTENSTSRFQMEFYKFLIPTYRTKKFDFVYFPDDMYCVPDEKGIPCPPLHFETNYKVFIYRNNRIEMYSACSY